MTRVATPGNEQVLLEMGLRTTAAHLELICRGMRRADRDDALARDVETRWVRQRTGDHGMVRIDAQLHPDEAAIVWAALERARAEQGIPLPDALVRVAAAFDPEGAAAARRPAEVVVHVREEMLGDGPGALAAVLEDGHRLPAETLRRVACDCVTQAVALGGDGLPIDVGRKRRTVTPALRRALIARDHGCRFPGCAHRAWLDAHHVEHWLEGGETSMANLVLLCPFHHRLVHEGGFSIARDQERWAFRDPNGHEVRGRPPAPPLARDLLSSMRRARADAGTWREDALVPLWDGSMPDVEACVIAGLQAAGRDADRRA